MLASMRTFTYTGTCTRVHIRMHTYHIHIPRTQLLEQRTGLKLEEVKANVNPKTKGAKYQINEEDEKVLRGKVHLIVSLGGQQRNGQHHVHRRTVLQM